MDKTRILLADDEDTILKPITLNLEAEGYTVKPVKNGAEALRAYNESRFDLVILDIMMPEMDGLNVCEAIRLQDSRVPILFLSARGTGEDRVKGLKTGADDYLPKPFNLEELLLRVSKLIARHQQVSHKPNLTEFAFGPNYVNFESMEARGTQSSFELTKKEALLLKLLIDHEGEVVSREKILSNVWGYAVYPSTRTIDNFILSFRKYFEEDVRTPRYFHSIRGVGYKFTKG